jgi:hypothetical protein
MLDALLPSYHPLEFLKSHLRYELFLWELHSAINILAEFDAGEPGYPNPRLSTCTFAAQAPYPQTAQEINLGNSITGIYMNVKAGALLLRQVVSFFCPSRRVFCVITPFEPVRTTRFLFFYLF